MSNPNNTPSHKGWIAAVTAIAALLAAIGVNQFFPDMVKRWTAPASHDLQFKGFYKELNNQGPFTEYLRFYPDGSVTKVLESETNAADAIRAFSSDNQALAKGSYVKTAEGKLEFIMADGLYIKGPDGKPKFVNSTIKAKGSYMGTVQGNHLQLRSNTNDSVFDYEFMEVPSFD